MRGTRRQGRAGAAGRRRASMPPGREPEEAPGGGHEARGGRLVSAPDQSGADHGRPEIDAGIVPLVEALNRIGALTEASCEGHLERLSTGEPCRPCLPYVVFRAGSPVITHVLEAARRLYYHPLEDGYLHALWYLESCPSPEGGIVHTLTPHPSFAFGGISGKDLAASQQDVATLARVLLESP